MLRQVDDLRQRGVGTGVLRRGCAKEGQSARRDAVGLACGVGGAELCKQGTQCKAWRLLGASLVDWVGASLQRHPALLATELPVTAGTDYCNPAAEGLKSFSATVGMPPWPIACNRRALW